MRRCPYDNPNCPAPGAPMGEGHHRDCLNRVWRLAREKHDATVRVTEANPTTVYVIEEEGATWVFYDLQAWLDGIEHEVRAGFDGPNALLAYIGSIPSERATGGDSPDDAAVEYVMQNVVPRVGRDA